MSKTNSTVKCCIDGCDRDADYKEKQLCQKHYFRIRRTGQSGIVKKARPRISDDRGYQFLHAPNHPLVSSGQIYVAEHRVVLYEAIGPDPMQCELCGKALTWKTCRVDHIDENPRNNDRGNLRPTCNSCNARRGTRPAHEWDHTTAITFEGETKTPNEWASDPRVTIAGATIRYRKRKGMTDAEALFGEKKTHNGKPHVDKRIRKTNFKHERKNAVRIDIDGKTMTASEWSRHPDCKVTVGAIVARIRLGWSHEDAVFMSPHSNKASQLKKEIQ